MSDYSPNPNPVPVPSMTQTSTLAIISLVTGIVSWFLLPLIASLAAVITGHMAKNEIKKSGGMLTGNGFATAGLVLGYVQLGLAACGCIVVLIMLALGVSIPFIGSGYNY